MVRQITNKSSRTIPSPTAQHNDTGQLALVRPVQAISKVLSPGSVVAHGRWTESTIL